MDSIWFVFKNIYIFILFYITYTFFKTIILHVFHDQDWHEIKLDVMFFIIYNQTIFSAYRSRNEMVDIQFLTFSK